MTTRTAKRTMNPLGLQPKPQAKQVPNHGACTYYPTIWFTKDPTPVKYYLGSRWFGWLRGKTDRFVLIHKCRVQLPICGRYEFRNGFTIPEGYKTDGVSTPKALWPLFPPQGLAFNASVALNYLYENKVFRKRTTCDKVYLDLMLEGGVPKSQAQIMYFLVRITGWWKWKKSRKQ